MAAHPLDRIFRARSVALVGASSDARKINGAPMAILRSTGFPGTILPVNPRYRDIDGIPCFPSIDALPGAPDVALVMLKAPEVPQALEACGRKGIRAAVCISSGFEETGGAAGLVEGVRAACARHAIALVGPNCEGVWSVRSKVLLTFGTAARREVLHHSPVAIVSQSGSFAGGVARQLQDSGVGCAYVVSVGNETCVGALDYVAYLIEQDDVRVVLLFVEGLQDGGRLPAIAARARARGIALVALKTGNSAIGQQAAASHTGKIATAGAVYGDVFSQCGIVSVDSLTDLVEAAALLTASRPLRRGADAARAGVSVFSVPGGTRAHTADLCESAGVPLAVFEDATVDALTARLPEFGYAKNPTDITGHAVSDPALLTDTLDLVAADPNTEALVVQLANRGPRDVVQHRDLMASVARRRDVPCIVSFLGDTLPAADRLALAREGLFCARDPKDAVRYLSWLYAARDAASRPSALPAWPSAQTRAAMPGAWRGWVPVLAACGVTVPDWRVLGPGDRATVACAGLGFPVAVKALPEDADHKTELGLVRLGVGAAAEVDTVAAELRRAAGRPSADLLVQQMVAGGVEAVLSLRRDPDFGVVLGIGSGGVLIELARDVGFLCAPFEATDVARVIGRLKLARLLAGYRGAPPADLDALCAAAVRLAQWFAASDATELELNPLVVRRRGGGVVALDVLGKTGGNHG
jgi:acyl-CoA synthetase (NDP forming)